MPRSEPLKRCTWLIAAGLLTLCLSCVSTSAQTVIANSKLQACVLDGSVGVPPPPLRRVAVAVSQHEACSPRLSSPITTWTFALIEVTFLRFRGSSGHPAHLAGIGCSHGVQPETCSHHCTAQLSVPGHAAAAIHGAMHRQVLRSAAINHSSDRCIVNPPRNVGPVSCCRIL